MPQDVPLLWFVHSTDRLDEVREGLHANDSRTVTAWTTLNAVCVRRIADQRSVSHILSHTPAEHTAHHDHPVNGKVYMVHDIRKVLPGQVVVEANNGFAKAVDLAHLLRVANGNEERVDSPRSSEDGIEVARREISYILLLAPLVNRTMTTGAEDFE